MTYVRPVELKKALQERPLQEQLALVDADALWGLIDDPKSPLFEDGRP
jgi:hypothetical protein